MRIYFDVRREWRDVAPSIGGLASKTRAYDPETCRERVLESEEFRADAIRRYLLHPLDLRWCYYSTVLPLWNSPRPTLAAQAWQGNRFFVARHFAERPNEGPATTLLPYLPDYHLLRPNVVAIPLLLRNGDRLTRRQHRTLFDAVGEGAFGESPTANLGRAARDYLARIGAGDPDADEATADLLWMHALAIGHSPSYLDENVDGIRRDWPRIPLPARRKSLDRSAALGREIAALPGPALTNPLSRQGLPAGTSRPSRSCGAS